MTRRHLALLCQLVLVGVLLALAGTGVLAAPPLDPGRVGSWVQRVGPAAAAMTLLRLAALAGVIWLAAAVLVDGLAQHHAGRRRPAALALPRRLQASLRRAAGVSLAVSPLMLPATLPTEAGPVRVGVEQGEPAPDDADPSDAPAGGSSGVAILRPLPTEEATISTSSTTTTPPRSMPTAPASSAAVPAAAPPSTTSTTQPPTSTTPSSTPTTALQPAADPVRPSLQPDRAAATGEATVAAGDSLWRLAEQRLAEALGRAPTEAEIVPYWTAVIDANRDRLRSSDPDVIYPGERIFLPAR